MTRKALPPELIREIYIDESSQTKNRYLVLGGVTLHGPVCREAEVAIQAARLPELPNGEIKWGKASRSKIEAYKRVVDVFWDHRTLQEAHFHSLFVDTSKLDHKKFNQGDREIGFSKEIYLLAKKFGQLYPGFFHLYLDERKTSQSTEELRLILNRGMMKDGDARDWPFRRCHFRDSKSSALLQMVDLFIGAIAYCINGHIASPEASEARTELARHIMRRAGIRNPIDGTARRGKFTVWERRLR